MYPRKHKGITDVEVHEERPILFEFPKLKSQVFIGGKRGLGFFLPCTRPCWWWRFWQWVFFGFEWRNYDS